MSKHPKPDAILEKYEDKVATVAQEKWDEKKKKGICLIFCFVKVLVKAYVGYISIG